MTVDPAIKVLICLSFLAAILLGTKLWQSEISLGWKAALTFVLFVPVIGPLAFVWIYYTPSKLPRYLQGHGGGMGAKFLDADLSKRAGGKTLYDQFSDEQKQKDRKWEQSKRKARRKNRT